MTGTATIFFHQTVSAIKQETRDKWGDVTFSTIYTGVACRFVFDTSRLRRIEEDERVDALVYIGPKWDVQPDYIMTFEGNDYMVIKVFHEYDLFGNIDHLKITLRARS